LQTETSDADSKVNERYGDFTSIVFTHAPK
jgi:hypothetical protein